ncbi:Signal transducer regulating beta-lactamase production, contains metallopeptidase domain [Ruminococcaceae bacterium YRB3002]|nr:Signal transducer regulating beta-lactamase production, contains metallopeptidase domain [Ruminococcaceae bacterium YRB3002]
MSELLTSILNMSLTGSIVILVVIAARFAMRKMPKKYMYLLWGIVGIRLLCPIALESRFSIFNIRPIRNSVESVKDLPLIQYGQGASESAAGAVKTASEAAASAASSAGAAHAHMQAGNTQLLVTCIWAAIAIGMLAYVVYQYIVIRRSLKDVRQVAPGLYSGHEIDTPFVMGFIRPRIYMPAGLTEDELEYLVLHEKTHIRRGDVFFKALGLAVVALHWFNPLVWVAYSLFVRDMEMSCDEEVIARLGDDVKVDYSMSLVSFARKSNGSKYIVVPIAFSNKAAGGKEVKMRIKNVLGYNGTSKLITTLALVVVAGVGLVCLSNARTFADENDGLDDETVAETTEETSDVTDDSILPEDTTAPENTDETVAVAVTDEDTDSEFEVITDFGPEDTEDADEDSDDMVPQQVLTPDSEYVNVGTEPCTDPRIINSSDNCLGVSLPILKGPEIDVELNLPAGIKVEDHPELDRFLVPNRPLESDVYAIYYKIAVSESLINEYIDALKDAGFTKDSYTDNGNFSGTNSDGLTALVEYVPECDYFRVAFFTRVNGANTFANVG